MEDQLDELILKCLEQDQPDLSPLREPLIQLAEDDPDGADSKIGMLRASLMDKGALRGVLTLYAVQAEINKTNRPWRKVAVRELSELFADDPLYTRFLQLSQLDSPRVRVLEAIRRMKVMADITPGACVFEKNRGFGVVSDVRHGEGKVAVDFEGNPGHEMVLGFAAEILTIVDSDHLFARKHDEPETINEMLKDDPAEIVRITLRSFGPTSAPAIQKLLVPAIVPEAKWKTFWANARKGLKEDSLVEIPTKRSEPIVLLTTEKSFDRVWFHTLANSRGMQHILDLIEELIEAGEQGAAVDEARIAVIDRLAFAVVGAEGKHHDYCVRAWLIARELNIDVEDINLASFIDRAFTDYGLLDIVGSLPAKLTKEFFAALAESREEETCEVLLKVLPELEYSALNEAISLLFDKGHEQRVNEVLRKGWNQWDAEVDVMYWLSMNNKKIAEWSYGTTPDLVARLLKVLNREYAGARLRVQNQLREVFRQPAWLKEVLGSMDERQRRAFTQGVKDSTAWEQLDKASVLGQIVKIDGSVQDIVSGTSSEEAEARSAAARVTSIRSFKLRQEQLDKLINKDIPDNSKEIAVARSYGDLRENFEYKAAKDTQRLLMQRKSEFEAMLREVKPTDFSEFSADVVGIATQVVLRDATGVESTYTILGEWDSEAERNIISSGSALAKAVQGASAGDTVTIPDATGSQEATVVAVNPLPADIQAYVADDSVSIDDEP